MKPRIDRDQRHHSIPDRTKSSDTLRTLIPVKWCTLTTRPFALSTVLPKRLTVAANSGTLARRSRSTEGRQTRR